MCYACSDPETSVRTKFLFSEDRTSFSLLDHSILSNLFPGHLLCWDDLFSFLIALPSSMSLPRASNSPFLIGCSNVNLSCYGITITTVQVKLHAFVDLLDLVY